MGTLELIIASEKRREAWTHLTKRQGASPVKHRKWRGVPCSRSGRIMVNMRILQKANYRANPVPIKISISFVTEIEKNTLKWIWNCKRLQIDKKNKSNAGRITIPSLKLQYRGIVSKTEWYRQKTDMWVGVTRRRRPSEPSLVTSDRNEIQMEGSHLWDQRQRLLEDT